MPAAKLLSSADKQLGRVTGLFAVLGALGILALMFIILVGVFWRYVLNNPIYGIEDISVLVLSIVAASAVLYGARNEAHVAVNVIKYFAGRKMTRVTDVIMRSLAVFTLFMASYALFKKACGFAKACITENLSIEHFPFYYLLSVIMALYGLHVLIQLLLGLVHWSGDDPNEVKD